MKPTIWPASPDTFAAMGAWRYEPPYDFVGARLHGVRRGWRSRPTERCTQAGANAV